MEKILVTSDLSEESKNAFAVAEQQAKRMGKDTKVIVLCVLPDLAKTSIEFAMGFALSNTEGAYERAFEKTSAELKNIVEEAFTDVDAEPVVVPASGATYRSILNFAESEDVEMVIIATHGRTGIRHAVLGSIAERIVRESDRPVLVVPAGAAADS